MMEEFKQKFIEEAEELITNLEESILILEKNPKDQEQVQLIFRIMHTLKGNGGMFGFNKISEFTHNLESIYDFVRNGDMDVTTDLLNITLKAVDHLKVLLEVGDDLDTQTQETHYHYTSQIEQIISRKSGGTGPAPRGTSPARTIQTNNFHHGESAFSTYFISFKPNDYIFNNGTNPLYLMDEISTMGHAVAIPHFENVPEITSFEPTKCYTWWEVFISTKENRGNLADVFIFVEDDAIIEITEIADYDLFEEKAFNTYAEFLQTENQHADLKEIKKIIDNATEITDIPEILEESPGLEQTDKSDVPQLGDREIKKPKPKAESSISSIRVSSDKVDTLMNLVSEMVTVQARLSLFAEQNNIPELIAISENVQKLAKQLRDNAFSISLIPIGSILTRFQRLVRDLSNELGKKINFEIEGEETELDKTIIERITDPLLHIIRNCLDHGIEKPELRLEKGKPETGSILFKAYYSGSNVHIMVRDDGAGLDPERILSKAKKKGLIDESEILDRKQIFDLIFAPGFSTAEVVSDVSGRGVGMDVVNKKISEIRGEVLIESEIDKGTTMTIILPLTLSIIDGMQVQIDDEYYIIPLGAVHKIYSITGTTAEKAFDNVIVLEGEQLPFFNLRKEFEIGGRVPQKLEVLVVKYEHGMVGLIIDKVIGEYQTVLKPLGKHYKKQQFISGGTILGDGSVALVLDTNKIISKFSRKNTKPEDVK
nr:chemotaxis protein CheA [Bacteroidota bacterium]